MKCDHLLVASILDIGETLLTSGAEVNRVEDTIRRIAEAYGFKKIDVFTITSSIVVTAVNKEEEIFTQTRRIKGYKTDMRKIDHLNSLSREICRTPLSLVELRERITHIRNADNYPASTIYITYGFIAAAFTLFFGGSFLDAIASFFCALILKFVESCGAKIQIQHLVLISLCSFCMSASALFMVVMNVGKSFDTIVIGNIMLLIPGVGFTTSLRDMINGDTISGLLGLAESLLKAFAIALGFALVIVLWGGLL